jgi:hypothetical protein
VFAFDGYDNYDPEPGEWSIWYGGGKSYLIWDTFGEAALRGRVREDPAH